MDHCTAAEKALFFVSFFFNQKVLIVFLFLYENMLWVLIESASVMSSYNICFHGEIRKYQCFLVGKKKRRKLFWSYVLPLFGDVISGFIHVVLPYMHV